MNNLLKYLNQTKVQIIILVVITFLAYSNSLANGLVWDDHLFLEAWPDIQSFDGLGNILKGSAPPSQDKIFRPVRGLIYIFNYSLWGATPFMFHLQALLIHLGITLLVYRISYIVYRKAINSDSRLPITYLPFFVALLFGLHPIHTETINYISASMETWGSLFFFLSFYLYLKSSSKFKIQNSKLLYLGSIVSAWVAFFTYEMTLTLPILIVLYDIVILRAKPEGSRFFSRYIGIRMTRYMPYFLGAAVFLLIRTATLGLVSRTEYLGYSFYLTALVMVKVFVRYILLLFAPINQTAIHNLVGDFPSSMIPYNSLEPILNQTIFDSDVLISIAIIIFVLIYSIKYIKRQSLISFCILWFFVSLIPVSYIIPHGGAMAEKYLYIASFGFCLLLAYLILLLISHFGGVTTKQHPSGVKLVLAGFALLVLMYLILTFNRNFVWKSDISLFSDVVAKSPDNLIANYTLGIWYAKFNQLKEAETHYKIALEKAPEFTEARFNLANLYLKGRDFDKATTEYDNLVKTNPKFNAAKNALTNIALLRESTNSAVIGEGVFVNFKSSKGFDFLFPVYWSIESSDNKETLKDPSGQVIVELELRIMNPAESEARQGRQESSIEEFLKQETKSYGKLVNQGKALIPGWDNAYVRVWEEDSIQGTGDRVQKLEFYLFKNDKVVKVLVNPVVPELMGEVDGILGSIKVY